MIQTVIKHLDQCIKVILKIKSYVNEDWIVKIIVKHVIKILSVNRDENNSLEK